MREAERGERACGRGRLHGLGDARDREQACRDRERTCEQALVGGSRSPAIVYTLPLPATMRCGSISAPSTRASWVPIVTAIG
jgi:hypothetical protein